MNTRHRQKLKNRYKRLTAEYARIFDGFSCGRQLAEQINPRLGEIGREIEAISSEVEEEIGGAK